MSRNIASLVADSCITQRIESSIPDIFLIKGYYTAQNPQEYTWLPLFAADLESYIHMKESRHHTRNFTQDLDATIVCQNFLFLEEYIKQLLLSKSRWYKNCVRYITFLIYCLKSKASVV
jgi:hypothetical protein